MLMSKHVTAGTVVGVMFAVLWLTSTAAAYETPPQYCMRTRADLTGWDKCTNVGVFKSVSKCYIADNGARVERYDYYRCQKVRGTWYLYRLYCPGPIAPTSDGTDVFNRYNEQTGRCDLPTPQPPSTTVATTSMTTTTTVDPTATTANPTSTTATTPDSSATTPDSSATTPDSSATTPDSSATTPDPTATTPDPTATTPDSSASTPDPTATTPDPTATTPATPPRGYKSLPIW